MAGTAVETHPGHAVVRVDVAQGALVARRAVAHKVVDVVVAGSAILARVGGALINVSLAECARVTRHA